jgi:hypothetical protein
MHRSMDVCLRSRVLVLGGLGEEKIGVVQYPVLGRDLEMAAHGGQLQEVSMCLFQRKLPGGLLGR